MSDSCSCCGHCWSEHDSWPPFRCLNVDYPISIERQCIVVRACECAEFMEVPAND